MNNRKYNSKRRAKHRELQEARMAEPEFSADATEQDTSMDVDVAEWSTTAAGDLTISNTAGTLTEQATGAEAELGDIKSDHEPLNMQEVPAALKTTVNDTSEENKNPHQLLRSVDFNVFTLANLARDHPNTLKSVTLLLSAAVMLAKNKAKEAQNTSDFTVGRPSKDAQTILTQAAHLAQLERRLQALEGLPRFPPTPSSSADTSDANQDQIAFLERALAASNARLEKVEHEMTQFRELVAKAVLPLTREGHLFDDVVSRLDVLADLRREGEEREFERRDAERRQEVESFRAENAQLRRECGETRAALEELRGQFMRMRTYFVAFLGGDLRRKEMMERLRELQVSGGSRTGEENAPIWNFSELGLNFNI